MMPLQIVLPIPGFAETVAVQAPALERSVVDSAASVAGAEAVLTA